MVPSSLPADSTATPSAIRCSEVDCRMCRNSHYLNVSTHWGATLATRSAVSNECAHSASLQPKMVSEGNATPRRLQPEDG